MSTELRSAAILDLPMDDNDAGAATVREYIVALAATVWGEGEGFSGKRPFGNSDWQWEIYRTLAGAGFFNAAKDDNGDFELDSEQIRRADAIILGAIGAMATGVEPEPRALTAAQMVRLEVVRVLLTAPDVEILEQGTPEVFGAEVVKAATPIADFIIRGRRHERDATPGLVS